MEKEYVLKLTEEDRQLVILALACLALLRPGFHYSLGFIAEKIDGVALLEEFKRLNADRLFDEFKRVEADRA